MAGNLESERYTLMFHSGKGKKTAGTTNGQMCHKGGGQGSAKAVSMTDKSWNGGDRKASPKDKAYTMNSGAHTPKDH